MYTSSICLCENRDPSPVPRRNGNFQSEKGPRFPETALVVLLENMAEIEKGLHDQWEDLEGSGSKKVHRALVRPIF